LALGCIYILILKARGKLFRGYGAVPADSVRPEIPGEPEPVGSRKTERGECLSCRDQQFDFDRPVCGELARGRNTAESSLCIRVALDYGPSPVPCARALGMRDFLPSSCVRVGKGGSGTVFFSARRSRLATAALRRSRRARCGRPRTREVRVSAATRGATSRRRTLRRMRPGTRARG
jgi:hypothetical protein